MQVRITQTAGNSHIDERSYISNYLWKEKYYFMITNSNHDRGLAFSEWQAITANNKT